MNSERGGDKEKDGREKLLVFFLILLVYLFVLIFAFV